MTSRELILRFESLQANLNQNKYLLDALRAMSNWQDAITALHARVLSFSDQANTWSVTTDTREKIRNITIEIKKFSPNRIFSEINSVLESLAKAESAFNSQTTDKLAILKRELQNLIETYEAFITAQQQAETARLLMAAQRADVAVNSSIEFATIVLKNLSTEDKSLSLNENRLEIYLSSETDFHLFLEKTSAIEHIYEELCQLFSVSAKQEPLKIVKVESGSAWAWLTGNKIVVASCISAITTAAHFVYRNYTTEGRLGTIPKKVEKIESILHLSDELKKRGINSEGLDHHISKASVIIGSNLEKLLEGENHIEINGEFIPLNPVGQQNLIAKRQIKLVEDAISKQLPFSNTSLLNNPPNTGEGQK